MPFPLGFLVIALMASLSCATVGASEDDGGAAIGEIIGTSIGEIHLRPYPDKRVRASKVPVNELSDKIIGKWDWGHGGHVVTYRDDGTFKELNGRNEIVNGKWVVVKDGVYCIFENGYTAFVHFRSDDELNVDSWSPEGHSWNMGATRKMNAAMKSPFDNLLENGAESRSREDGNKGSIIDGIPVTTRDGKSQDEDWYAVHMDQPIMFRQISFSHGVTGPDGGWFNAARGKPKIQVMTDRKIREWVTVGELSSYPETTATDSRGLRSGDEFIFTCDKEIKALAVRIIGAPAGSPASGGNYSSCGGFRATAQEIPRAPAFSDVQHFVFEYKHINYAWGFQCSGICINSDGGVYSYRITDEKSARQLHADTKFTDEDLAKYHGKMKYIMSISKSLVAFYAGKIESCKSGKIVSNGHMACDAGSGAYCGYAYDEASKMYDEISLFQDGDRGAENDAPEAAVISNWMKRVLLKAVEIERRQRVFDK